jgi:hypothetical protein
MVQMPFVLKLTQKPCKFVKDEIDEDEIIT